MENALLLVISIIQGVEKFWYKLCLVIENIEIFLFFNNKKIENALFLR